MIRKEIDRNKRSKHFPTSTFVGNNRQMLQEIRDSLSHLRKVQPVDFRNDNIQLKLDLTPTASNIGDIRSGGGKMTRSGHGSGYHQKALAEIRDSLLPFANENGINGNFGRETGHEREIQVNRVMLHHLINMGYDEEISSRALKLCGNKSLDAAQDAILKMVSQENKSERVNGIIQTGSSGYPSFVCKMVSRSPGESSPSGGVAFNSNNREVSLGISSPAAVDNNNPRPASPGMSLQPRPFTEAWMFSYPGESRNHPPVSRQYSPSHGETPPPPPPRTQPPPPTPPPLPQMDFRPVQPPSSQQLSVISSSAPQILKRMSPIPQATRPQGAGYTASPSQSSTPQRGMSPVSSSRQQNNHLTQQITSLTLYQNAASSSDAPPPYSVSQTNSVAAMISKFSTPPPPYAAAPQTRQSPTQPVSNEFNQIAKRPTISNYHTPLTLNLKSVSPGNCPITPLSMATTSGNLQPAPVQAWRQAKAQSPIIMQSVRSTQVQKPILQTAVAPTSPPISANLTSLPSSNKVGGTLSALTYTSPQTTSSLTTIINTPTTPSNNDIPIASSPSYTTNIQTLPSTYGLISSSPEAFTTNTTTTIQAQSGQVVTVQSTRTKPIPNTSPQQQSNCIVKSKHNAQTETQSPCNATLQHLPLQRRISPALPETQNSTPRSDSPVSHATSQSPVSVVSTASSPSTNSDPPPPDLRSPPPPYTTRHHSPMPERKAQSREIEDERRETKVRNYSPQAFKFFMEQHVENLLKSHQQRVHRRMQLETEMAKVGLSEEAQLQMRRMLHQKESNYIRLKRAKMDKSQFLKIKTIGIGAFGEVALVRKIDTNQLYAMKTLRKVHVLTRNQVAHVKAERDILAEADNEWVVKLYYSFQDTDHLYFVMDYVPGGDMMSLLIKFGIFQDPLARFYIAELVCAIESVHKMGFIHRDIKPDNILIDRDGHIKLTDFGLCTGFRWTHNSKYYQKNGEHNRQDSMDLDETWDNDCRCEVSSKPLERRKRREHQRCLAHSLVGTPNYIAPEVLKRTGYTQLCDWWSVGVILYEMLVGQPPFLANTPAETQYKVINWETTLRIPKQAKLSPEATDLILQLCCGPEKRLGCRNGAPDIKSHPFFQVIAWDSGLRRQPAPYFPCIRYATDTSNFDPVDPDKLRESGSSDDGQRMDKGYENGKHPEHAFFEFTFRRFFDDGGHAYPTRSRDMDPGPVFV